MDFRTGQSHGATFFYVLPFSTTEALVEYTLFSPALLEEDAYEAALKTYVEEVMGVTEYTIEEKERGSIPMTNFRFPSGHGNMVNIGTAGGQTKGSSGYTFQFIQKHSAAIVAALERKEHPSHARSQRPRFQFYDSVLLHILANKTLHGADIFSDLFRKNKPQNVLKFLDNETSLKEDIGLISSLPTVPFAKAAMLHLLQ
jgi:lycopene beta-cyclase